MHDNHSVAFQIYLGRKIDKKGNYRDPFITIWHVDPETDGTDDSCGWFINMRHANKDVYDLIVKEFTFEWDNEFKGQNGHIYPTGWFQKNGEPNLTIGSIALNMYLYAAKIVFDPAGKNMTKAWSDAWDFVYKHRSHIDYFVENNRDSFHFILLRTVQKVNNVRYTAEEREKMIRECAKTVYLDILSKNRKWYQHPRWHIHHWEITFPFFRAIKRRYFDKCCVCGKRGFKSSAISDWNGTKIWHQECDSSAKVMNNSLGTA